MGNRRPTTAVRRRALLAALTGATTALAGCGALSDDDRTSRPTLGVERTHTADPNDAAAYDEDPPDEPESAVTTDGFRRRVALFDVSSAAPDLDYRVGLLGRDDGGPVRLWIAVTNAGDDERELEFDAAVPFGAPVGVSLAVRSRSFAVDPDGPRLWLVPASDPAYGSVRPDDARAGCWRAAGDVDGTGLVRSVALDPGDTAGQTFALLTPPDVDGCLPTGDYRFETADDRLGFSLAVWVPTTGPPASALSDVSLPALDAETTWFHDARDTVAPVYLEPASESIAAGRSLEFTLHNHGTEPITTTGRELLRSDGSAWLPVLEDDGPLPGTDELVPPGGSTRLSVGFGRYEPAATLRALRAGHYALRLRLAGDDPAPAAAVAVTEGTEPTLSTTARFRTVERADGTLTLDRGRGDRDGEAVLELERGGPGDAPAVPLERLLRLQALRNALASLVDAEGVSTVRLWAEAGLATAAVEGAVPDDAATAADGEAAFGFRGRTYTVRVHG